MARYASFKNNILHGAGNVSKTLAQIKAVKEVDGVTVFSITQSKLDMINDGWTATESGGIVSVVEPVGWLAEYQTKAKAKLKAKGKIHAYSIWTIKDQLNVNGGLEAGNTTKARKDTFVNAMKTEWGVVKTAINNAVNKAGVDAVTPSWPTTPAP
jgi:hypothetical protein